jgi:hypothetical protein
VCCSSEQWLSSAVELPSSVSMIKGGTSEIVVIEGNRISFGFAARYASTSCVKRHLHSIRGIHRGSRTRTRTHLHARIFSHWRLSSIVQVDHVPCQTCGPYWHHASPSFASWSTFCGHPCPLRQYLPHSQMMFQCELLNLLLHHHQPQEGPQGTTGIYRR